MPRNDCVVPGLMPRCNKVLSSLYWNKVSVPAWGKFIQVAEFQVTFIRILFKNLSFGFSIWLGNQNSILKVKCENVLRISWNSVCFTIYLPICEYDACIGNLCVLFCTLVDLLIFRLWYISDLLNERHVLLNVQYIMCDNAQGRSGLYYIWVKPVRQVMHWHIVSVNYYVFAYLLFNLYSVS